MLTAIHAMGKVHGAEWLLGGVLLCGILYFAICLLFSGNRSRRGIKTLIRCFIAAAAICDAFWFLLYFPGGEYVNYGIGGVYGSLLWPVLMLIAGVFGTIQNDQKQ